MERRSKNINIIYNEVGKKVNKIQKQKLNENLDIGKVVLNVMVMYQNMPNTIQRIVTEGHFCTNIAEPHEYQGKDGVIGIKYKNIAVVDFTQPMTLNKEEFIDRTNHVYQEFINVTRWYFAGYDQNH